MEVQYLDLGALIYVLRLFDKLLFLSVWGYLLDFLNELFRYCILIPLHILTKPTTRERRFIFMEVLFGLIGFYVAEIVSWNSSEASTI